MITLTLPMPPSANKYWRTATIAGRAQTYLSKEAKDFKREVAAIVEAADVLLVQGRVHVGVYLYPQRPLDWAKRAKKDPLYWDDSVKRIDLDNARKAVYDALKNIAFEDDKRVTKDAGEVMCPDGEGRLVVTIRSLSESPSASPVQDLIDQLLRLDPNLMVVNKQTAQAVLF